MNIRDLIPWGRSGNLSRYRETEQNPFLILHREINKLFDDAFRGLESPALQNIWTASWPNVEISDVENEVRVMAEVPGLEEKDIEVLLADGALILKGEKRSETEDKDRAFSERFYGRFERRIPLGIEIDPEKVSAEFKNGILTVMLPKSAESRARTKRIAIKAGS